jgi:hypothetical protein
VSRTSQLRYLFDAEKCEEEVHFALGIRHAGVLSETSEQGGQSGGANHTEKSDQLAVG